MNMSDENDSSLFVNSFYCLILHFLEKEKSVLYLTRKTGQTNSLPLIGTLNAVVINGMCHMVIDNSTLILCTIATLQRLRSPVRESFSYGMRNILL